MSLLKEKLPLQTVKRGPKTPILTFSSSYTDFSEILFSISISKDEKSQVKSLASALLT